MISVVDESCPRVQGFYVAHHRFRKCIRHYSTESRKHRDPTRNEECSSAPQVLGGYRSSSRVVWDDTYEGTIHFGWVLTSMLNHHNNFSEISIVVLKNWFGRIHEEYELF